VMVLVKSVFLDGADLLSKEIKILGLVWLQSKNSKG